MKDPEKAAASELNKQKFSGWIVRLMAVPEWSLKKPTKSDKVLILTADKKLRTSRRDKVLEGITTE
jgi:hypothetical protein